MTRFIDHKKMGRGIHGWLDSHFHFSFADYFNPGNMGFGVLRVLNDDIVLPGAGFDPHPHRDMEIVSYVVSGELTHTDSMGNKRTLARGQAQYMSAGTGVVHGEHNLSGKPLRFLQIWIVPDRENHRPSYGDFGFEWEDRLDRWMPIASGKDSAAPIRIHADANLFAAEITDGQSLAFPVDAGRQAYLVLVEGAAKIGDRSLAARDAMEIVEEGIEIQATNHAHVLVVEMKKEERF